MVGWQNPASRSFSVAIDRPWNEVRGVVVLVIVLEIESLWLRALVPPVIVVIVEATVDPLKVRVRSQANSFSPARETCFGEEGPFLNHWDIRLGSGTEAMVLRFSAVEGRRRDEIREGVVRELIADGETFDEGDSFNGSSRVPSA